MIPTQKRRAHFVVKARPMGLRAGFDPAGLNKLADDLEADAITAIEHEAVLHTADADFVRFPGLRWLNPISGVSSRSVPKGRPG